MDTRILAAGDEGRAEAFLSRHADTSMLLRGNLRAGGLEYRGAPQQCVWAAAVEGEEVAAIAAHSWVDTLLVQGREGAVTLAARAALAASRRPLAGILGPWPSVTAVRAALGLSDAETTLAEREVLFTLSLDRLAVPAALARAEVQCRLAADAEIPLLTAWRRDYLVETGLASAQGAHLDARAASSIALMHGQRNLYVLLRDDAPVAMTAFNARLPEAVQVGNVWTPKALRGRGHARSAVAGQLLHARAAGASRAVLFTGEEQPAAQAAYRSLGFVEAGDYGTVMFAQPQPLVR